ncbi:SDR family NAD(P)-dependent oxidoreductase [Congregibacter sp.]|uniref:SDR family NAD(P)-dependent oxidoreductase n=1 Tax=Congregibacter sp. TaxID=2744308 RepID=UPI00385DF053
MHLRAARSDLGSQGIQVQTEILYVRDANAFRDVADRTLAAHCKLNFLFNNAGVGAGYALSGNTPLDDWRWVMDVNVMGVVNGVGCFLPAMQESGEPGYSINTASLDGLEAQPGEGPYITSKFAVVGYSEVLQLELEGSNNDASVLCPAWVKTRIAQSLRNHPDPARAAKNYEGEAGGRYSRIIEAEGISVTSVRERVVAGMAAKSLYLFTHHSHWRFLEERISHNTTDCHQILPSNKFTGSHSESLMASPYLFHHKTRRSTVWPM